MTTCVLSIGPKLKSPFCSLFTEQICCCVANSCLVLYHRGKSHSGTNAISTRHRCVKMHKFANAVKFMKNNIIVGEFALPPPNLNKRPLWPFCITCCRSLLKTKMYGRWKHWALDIQNGSKTKRFTSHPP